MKNNRILNEKKVSPIWYYNFYSTPKIRGMLVGQIDGETIVDDTGKPIPYKKIGKLEGETKKEEPGRGKKSRRR